MPLIEFEEKVDVPPESEDADMFDRISREPKKSLVEVPSRVHRIKQRRELHVTHLADRGCIYYHISIYYLDHVKECLTEK